MPIIKSAKKKLRKDKKRTTHNLSYEKAYREAIQLAKKGGSNITKLVNQAFSKIDKAAKRKVIHKNKASRLKSIVSKLLKTKKASK